MTSKWIKAGVATFVLATLPVAASAADMPAKGPYYKGAPRSVVAYYNWTGFYAGINGGYGFGKSNWSTPAISTSPKGAMFGGTLGYNYQTGSFVWGLEGDFDWSGVKGSAACGAFTCESKNTWLATFRGRVGYALDRWLPYVTGGGAYGNIKATSTDPAAAGASKSQLGWTAGVGVEYAFLGSWTAKVEYLYVDLGKFDCTTCVAGTTTNISFKENIVRAGLNYKFSGPIFSRF